MDRAAQKVQYVEDDKTRRNIHFLKKLYLSWISLNLIENFSKLTKSTIAVFAVCPCSKFMSRPALDNLAPLSLKGKSFLRGPFVSSFHFILLENTLHAEQLLRL